ncbi:3-ketoacyl-ACP reductase [Photobacterium sp. 1_MG-2023]|nr:3-ketoacyl-ACP reductase [Photobacterium sp. 1_MG-2023]MDO6706022.1 3-ketoacyl-ACP reductase [Photobacterium sp. 1_MG-2023]
MKEINQKLMAILSKFTSYLSMLMLVIGGGLALYAMIYGP